MNRDKQNNFNKNNKPPVAQPQDTIWDFERDESGHGFVFSRRDPAQPYRVLGETPNRPVRRAPLVAPSRATANKFNSSVKMLPGDVPAPWEENYNREVKKMPVVGEVAAGRFDVTVAYHQPGYEADADFVFINPTDVKLNPTTFALRVRGSSMIENDIEDGDIILVQSQNWADDGDFVIACLTDSTDAAGFVTLKRFYRHKHTDRVVLQPANQSLSPIHILPRKGDAQNEDLDGIKIQGRVTAVIKTHAF